MSKVHAILIKNNLLEQEILFRKVKHYIESSLKASDIHDIFYVDCLSDINDEMKNAEYLIIIEDIVPEILEYRELIEQHKAIGADISYFSLPIHSHENGIMMDNDNQPCGFGCGDFSKIDIYIINAKDDKLEVLKQDPFAHFVHFVNISQSHVIESLTDIILLSNDFKEEINHCHIENGVLILDPANTYIAPDVSIGTGTIIQPNTIIKGNTMIGCGCQLGPNTVIDGCTIDADVKINSSQCFESMIGEGTQIGPFAYIRPESHLGRNVKIGDFVEIKKSTIDDGTKVSHLTYIGDASVGKNVNFGCGTVVVNYDGFTKHQTIIEDDAFIGCNTNLVSPVMIGKGAYTAAGSTISQNVPQNALGIARTKQLNKESWAEKYRILKKDKK